ncbi:alpha/beta fold hydrolase [Microbacterium sp. NPDC057944]|uniref:alpha/beta fold hydrolase n=1 Tax=Microbacterium sp. NPDC057944 TaxID=3346286 RepID=UPI0036DFA154
MSGLATTSYGRTTDERAMLAVHGITANGRSWGAVAAHLDEHPLLAPDLRGRGRSNRLPGSYGLRRHADDLADLLDDDGGEPRIVLGHSMGAFVVVMLAARRPDLVERLVLVDGGFPLALPSGAESADDLDIAALLGPAARRLETHFADADAYLGFWRQHPAFSRDWSDIVEDYARYDLDGTRASTVAAAMIEDGAELYGPAWYVEALRSLRMPVTVLRAPRGLTDAEPLYAPGALEGFRALVPQLDVVEIDDVNHYTILFADRGASRVAASALAARPA